MLSSSAAFVVMSVGGSSDSLLYLFCVYGFWARRVILFFYYLGDFGLGGVGRYFIFIFLLVSIPVSLSVFYKVFMGLCVYSCYLIPFIC